MPLRDAPGDRRMDRKRHRGTRVTLGINGWSLVLPFRLPAEARDRLVKANRYYNVSEPQFATLEGAVTWELADWSDSTSPGAVRSELAEIGKVAGSLATRLRALHPMATAALLREMHDESHRKRGQLVMPA